MKRLGDRLFAEITRVYRGINSGFEPSWFPIFFLLNRDGVHSVSSLAREMGVTDSAVSQLIRQMKDRGIIVMSVQKGDKRAGSISLSAQGIDMLNQVKPIWKAIEATLEENLMSGRHGPSLLYALAELEDFMEKNDLAQQIRDRVDVELHQKKYRIVSDVSGYQDWIQDFLLTLTIKPHPSWLEPLDVVFAKSPGTAPVYQHHLLLHENRPVALLTSSSQSKPILTETIHFCAAQIQPASAIEIFFLDQFSRARSGCLSLSVYRADKGFLYRLQQIGYSLNPVQTEIGTGRLDLVYFPKHKQNKE
jgi:DNA-binding MarR family transcriptional regulator